MQTSGKDKLTGAEIVERLADILEPWLAEPDAIAALAEETNLLSDLGLDSIAILQVVLGAEREFGISIDDKELDSNTFSALGNFVRLIQEKMDEAD